MRDGRRSNTVKLMEQCHFLLTCLPVRACSFSFVCSEKDGSMRDPVYYVPTCVCLVSEYAYHTVLKDCLSGLVPFRPGLRACSVVFRPPLPAGSCCDKLAIG